jgi:hypothetical protein
MSRAERNPACGDIRAIVRAGLAGAGQRVSERTATVRARDRRWFAKHPGEDRYVRPVVPGEHWPPHEWASATHVLVTSYGPLLRTRQPVTVRIGDPDSPWMTVVGRDGWAVRCRLSRPGAT